MPPVPGQLVCGHLCLELCPPTPASPDAQPGSCLWHECVSLGWPGSQPLPPLQVAPQPLWFSDAVANLRKLKELPYHLLHSGRIEELKQEVLGKGHAPLGGG